MGYTNYWTTNNEITEFQKKKMATFAKKAVELSGVPIKGYDGTGEAEITEESIRFNGDGETEEDHETFELYDDSWAFCKTARKPYDKVVKAVLIFAERTGIISSWSFDGYRTEDEFLEGQELYNKTVLTLAGKKV